MDTIIGYKRLVPMPLPGCWMSPSFRVYWRDDTLTAHEEPAPDNDSGICVMFDPEALTPGEHQGQIVAVQLWPPIVVGGGGARGWRARVTQYDPRERQMWLAFYSLCHPPMLLQQVNMAIVATLAVNMDNEAINAWGRAWLGGHHHPPPRINCNSDHAPAAIAAREAAAWATLWLERQCPIYAPDGPTSTIQWAIRANREAALAALEAYQEVTTPENGIAR